MVLPHDKLDPIRNAEQILELVRSTIASVFPYRGILAVTFPGIDSPEDPSRSLRLTGGRRPMPASTNPTFTSASALGATDELADRLVKALVYDEPIAYDGDLVISVAELPDADPLALRVGPRTIYVEFGFIESEGYRPA